MSITWARFLSDLEAGQGREATLQFECKGAFLKFRSQLAHVERPSAFSPETMSTFGVVPHHVTLTFANGVRINLYMRHVKEVTRRDGNVVVSFRGEGNAKNLVAFSLGESREGYAG